MAYWRQSTKIYTMVDALVSAWVLAVLDLARLKIGCFRDFCQIVKIFSAYAQISLIEPSEAHRSYTKCISTIVLKFLGSRAVLECPSWK